ncbi:DoxX family protein [Leptolyngbya sp. FACHB-261]|uniref:DoxX family protein n=1 Tax=Leptolyngbya sp. FACHB-261 TaxID=2692806 RepID=UPI001681E9FA|nr:DoxX family protein [Leptolyngbya sp. FACHB-261]MBD2100545.1 DoxX family protein [Leptolyngbya sp. FACHB-261]
MKLKILSSNANSAQISKAERINGRYLPGKQPFVGANQIIPLLARVLLAAIFLWSGVNKILHPVATQQYMAANGMTFTGFFLVAAIALELGGGLSLVLGYRPRWGALVLILFLVPATLIFHTNFSDQIQAIMFMKNLAMLGGLLMVVQYGAGSLAIDPDV